MHPVSIQKGLDECLFVRDTDIIELLQKLHVFFLCLNIQNRSIRDLPDSILDVSSSIPVYCMPIRNRFLRLPVNKIGCSHVSTHHGLHLLRMSGNIIRRGHQHATGMAWPQVARSAQTPAHTHGKGLGRVRLPGDKCLYLVGTQVR